jgi:DNA repair exonuclease SbcCD nuclease subunit
MKLLHIADVHLGARHAHLGQIAARQRERQFDAFARAIDLALERRVDAVLVCGDLFDSNLASRRTVERAALELARLASAGIRALVLPGSHDCHDHASIYRVFDLAKMADNGGGMVTVLTPANPRVSVPERGIVFHGIVFDTKRAPRSPLSGATVSPHAWNVGLLHGSIAIPGRVDDDDVLVTRDEIAASGLDYLALGHWHSYQSGREGDTTWAYPGSVEPLAIDQAGAGNVVLVTMTESAGRREVAVEPLRVGRTAIRSIEVDLGAIGSDAELLNVVRGHANDEVMLTVRLVGMLDESASVDTTAVVAAAASSFLLLRMVDVSIPPSLSGPVPPASTAAGRFARTIMARVAEAELSGDARSAAFHREVLRLGTALLDDPRRVELA